MAILDSLENFADEQSLASISSAGSTKSTNVVDTGTGQTDAFGTAIGKVCDSNLRLCANVHTALVGASANLDVQFVSKASSASISSGATVHASIRIPALTAAGAKFSIGVPQVELNRYVGVLWTAAGGALTSAKVHAWLGRDSEITD